ncbi:hypothetical protein [Sphingomonas sp. 179-A 2A2 NHS]|uniref:hypothetical protein n=1 Tax=Sphingomonas sp. 179-A 2A2 NHS TaxID=3374290 RepID=UPI00387943C7
MTVRADISRRQGIMAVLVLYGRPLEDAVSWPVLRSWLDDDSHAGLRHCLVYDNSPMSLTDGGSLPANAHLLHDPDNSGTAGAYAAAVDYAARTGCEWLLLLDQDTALPADYLAIARETMAATPDAEVMVPRVRHDAQLVSPATITRAGTVRPCAAPDHVAGMTTAISSGAVVRRRAIENVVFPPSIWLDYVDHWLFLRLHRHGAYVAVIDTDLSHDLSVRTPATLSAARLASILAAESTFYIALGGRARAVLPLRRLMRAARYAAIGRLALAGTVLRTLIDPARLPHHD